MPINSCLDNGNSRSTISTVIDILNMADCCKNPSDSKKISDLADILKVISEPNRLKILCLLKSGTKCVCEIQKSLKLNQNLVSHHLKVLRDAGLIESEKLCQWKHYSLNAKALAKYATIFNKLLT